jgi:hypothetical protein
VLHLEDLARAVRGFAERDDARVADPLAQEREVVEAVARLDGLERDGVGAQPVVLGRGDGGEEQNGSQKAR